MKNSFNIYLSAVILLISLISCGSNSQVKNPDHKIGALKDSPVDTNKMGIATLSTINLRKEPHHSSELVSQVILGTPVMILKSEDSWLQIQTPDSYTGWIEEASVKSVNKVEIDAWKKAEKVIYLENTGWLYNSASEKEGVVGDLVGGSIIEKIGESGGYVNVILPDGRKGFIEKRKVMNFNEWEKNISPAAETVCSMAFTYLGLPYLWGGTSTKGVDCSGFVQSVFFRNGLILRRDASLQAIHGLPVDISDGFSRLRKGDLLFFGSKNNGTSHVTHVALYLGNNEYINSSGRVQINSLDSTKENFNSHRMNSLLLAKRILGVSNDPGIEPVNKHKWY
jgi:SH3-like domain-containing protein